MAAVWGSAGSHCHCEGNIREHQGGCWPRCCAQLCEATELAEWGYTSWGTKNNKLLEFELLIVSMLLLPRDLCFDFVWFCRLYVPWEMWPVTLQYSMRLFLHMTCSCHYCNCSKDIPDCHCWGIVPGPSELSAEAARSSTLNMWALEVNWLYIGLCLFYYWFDCLVCVGSGEVSPPSFGTTHWLSRRGSLKWCLLGNFFHVWWLRWQQKNPSSDRCQSMPSLSRASYVSFSIFSFMHDVFILEI